MITVSRPTVTVTSSPNGKNFTIESSTPGHEFEYQLTSKYFLVLHGMEGFPQTKEAAENLATEFSTAYENEAKKIESGAKRPYHIMGNLKEHGMAKSRRKLSFGG